MSDWNQKIIEEFRANQGVVGGPFSGATLLLLTTAGRKTGRPHTTPVVYRRSADRLLVFASNAGHDQHPAWYHNLRANPYVRVELGTETRRMIAHPVTGAERDEEYGRQAALVPAFADYQAKTDRVIPVIALVADERARALGDELVKIHAGLRAELESLPAGSSRPLTAQLAERCLTFCQNLHEHHTKEDAGGFPLLERRFPGIGPVLDRLRAEHEALAALREEFEQHPDPVRLKTLAADLLAHFDHEERELIPALNTL